MNRKSIPTLVFSFLSLISFFLLGFSCSKRIDPHFSIASTKDELMVENTEDLTLFINPNCPFCAKVLNYMEKHKIKLTVKDTQEEENKHFLIKNGGKKQVPCLFIDDIALYESNDIINYMSEIFAVEN